jgi:hypothetical protein
VQYQGIHPSVITDLRAQARLNISEAAEICGVQIKCFERWESSGTIPKVAYELLKARAGAIRAGWTWHNGVLTDYAGRTYREHDLMAAFYTLAAAEARNIEFIHAKAGNLKHENNEKLKRAPAPSSVAVPDFTGTQRCLKI